MDELLSLGLMNASQVFLLLLFLFYYLIKIRVDIINNKFAGFYVNFFYLICMFSVLFTDIP